MDAEDEGYVEQEDEVKDNLEDKDLNERFEIFSKYHNSIVGHFWDRQHFECHVVGGATMAGHAKRRHKMDRGMYNLSEDQIANRGDAIGHHIYHLDPLASLSVDTLGPLPEDENGFSFIVFIVNNFSKIVGLYPARRTTSKDNFIGALLQWVGIFGVPKDILLTYQ